MPNLDQTSLDLKGQIEAKHKLAKEKLQTGVVEDQKHAMDLYKEADVLVEQLTARTNVLAKETEQRKALQAAADSLESDEPEAKGQSWKTFGHFLHAAWRAKGRHGAPDPRLVWMADMGDEQKAMSEQTGASGGFLVPTEYNNELMAAAAETSIVRSRATVIPMRRRQIQMPVLDQTGTNSGAPGNFFGGMSFSWTEEAAEKTEDNPNFRQVTLTAHKLVGYTRVSDELVDDSAVSLDAFFRSPLGMAGGIAWQEDYAFLRGTGTGQPLGVINAGATVTVNRNATNPAVDFQNDLANMRSQLYTGMGGSPVWVINQALMNEIITLNGPTGNPSYIWQPNARDGIPGFLLGYPVIWTEKLPAQNTSGDILLANFAFYMIGDRQSTTIESTQFDRWRYDQTSWRAVHRVDGRPWLSAPLTLADGTFQVSPFVILGAKST